VPGALSRVQASVGQRVIERRAEAGRQRSLKPQTGLIRDATGVTRCWWPGDDPLYLRYHDEEWGAPVSDDRRLFEKICLEGFQAGLSWLTILRKRPHFRKAFADFDIDRVVQFGARDVGRLLADEGIVRHRGKIESTINNAKRAADLRDEFGSLARYFWQWEPEPGSRPRRLTRDALMQLGRTPESTALSKDLKRRGWTFVGPTTVYAFMQAMGLVNDHVEGCARRSAVESARATFRRPAVSRHHPA
jgi:DNA-3-methyladenine glycosylase I